VVILTLYIGEKGWLLLDKRKYQATENSYSIINSHVGSLAKKERNIRSVPKRLCQLLDNTVKEHYLTFARIAPDLEETVALVVLPSLKFLVVENPAV
jgi:hypothetical protein